MSIFWGIYSGDAELQVRVEAAMSSGEGAEETTKDASDIPPFLKTGKPKKEWERSDGAPLGAAPFGPAT